MNTKRWLTPDPINIGSTLFEIEQIKGITYSTRLLKQEPQRQNPFVYVVNTPINFIDPFGLSHCASGQCSDCPSGKWVGVSGSAGGAFFIGAYTSVLSVACKDADIACTTVFSCTSKGFDISIGGSLSPTTCERMYCKESINKSYESSWGLTIGPVGIPISPGTGCDGLSVGGGKGGFGIAIAKSACKPMFTNCR